MAERSRVASMRGRWPVLRESFALGAFTPTLFYASCRRAEVGIRMARSLPGGIEAQRSTTACRRSL